MILVAGYRKEIKCSKCGNITAKQFKTEPGHAIQDLRRQKLFREYCEHCGKFTPHEILKEKAQ